MRIFKNPVWILGLIIILITMAAFNFRNLTPAKPDTIITAEKGFAVLELFTSEGCSSCPPADDLVSRIQKEAGGKPIYILAYHVDYWDRLGWKDMFSSADFSKRQRQYGDWLHVSPIYTPQIVINGQTQFVGSNETAIRREITEQLSAPFKSALTIQVHQVNENLNVQYAGGKTIKGSNLLIAIIQKKAESKVDRGENAGLVLSHVQIVRHLQTEPLSAAGEGSFLVGLPKDFNKQNWEILALVQDQHNGEILSVSKAMLVD